MEKGMDDQESGLYFTLCSGKAKNYKIVGDDIEQIYQAFKARLISECFLPQIFEKK